MACEDDSRLDEAASAKDPEAALEALLGGTVDPLERDRVRWVLEFARARLREAAPLESALADECAGRYEDIDVLAHGGALALMTDDGEIHEMLPMGGDGAFYFPDVPEIRARFLRGRDGRVVALRVFSWRGAPRDHARTS